MLQNLRVVLSHPTHPGNIGAVARAMKTMGLKHLCLINPKRFPHEEATARASGAEDILTHAFVFSRLKDAISDCHYVLGASARSRALIWPVLTAQDCAKKVSHWLPQKKIALLFGNERSGLGNEELQHCQYHIIIPTDKEYTSLNLAASVQILAYEIFQRVTQKMELQFVEPMSDTITNQNYMRLFSQIEKTLIMIDYLNPAIPKQLMSRIKRLLYKANLQPEEFQICMGICKAVLDTTILD